MRFHFIVFITVCLSWSSIEAADYNYPYRDPYLATATTAILNDEGPTTRVKSQVVHVPGPLAEISCLLSKDAAS